MSPRCAARRATLSALLALAALAGLCSAYEARAGNALRNKIAAQLRQEHQLRADRVKGVRPDHSAQPTLNLGGITSNPTASPAAMSSQSSSASTEDDDWAGHTQIVIGSPQTTRVILPRPQTARPSASSSPLPIVAAKPEPAHISRTLGRLGRPISAVARLLWRALRLVGVIVFRLLRIATVPLLVPIWLAAYPLEFALALIVDFQPALSFLSVALTVGVVAGAIAGWSSGVVGDWLLRPSRFASRVAQTFEPRVRHAPEVKRERRQRQRIGSLPEPQAVTESSTDDDEPLIEPDRLWRESMRRSSLGQRLSPEGMSARRRDKGKGRAG